MSSIKRGKPLARKASDQETIAWIPTDFAFLADGSSWFGIPEMTATRWSSSPIRTEIGNWRANAFASASSRAQFPVIG